jgi:putative transcriptional regulator
MTQVPRCVADSLVNLFRISAYFFMETLKGHLLIASPQLESPIFTRSVILVIEQNDEGALGVIVNQQISTTLTDLSGKIFADDFEWDKPLSLGGPVASSLMMLHTNEALADQEIIPGVYITTDGSKVQELIDERSEPSLVVANYSGWGPGQLDGELLADSWLTLPATVDHVFWTGQRDLWNVAVNQVQARALAVLAGVRELPPDPTRN